MSSSASTTPPSIAAIHDTATWSRPSLVAAFGKEAEVYSYPYVQTALSMSGLPWSASPSSPPTARILEVCAGTGGLTFAALPFVAHITCTDFADGMVEAVRSKAQRLGVAHKVTAEVRDCTDLSAYGDSTFDAVFCMLGLFMLPSDESRQQALREMHRVVKKGGCVVVYNWAAWDRSHLHTLLFKCSVQARLAKKALSTPSAPSTGTALPPIHPPVAILGSEEEHRALFGLVPFSSVSTQTLSQPTRTFLTPTDFWYALKSIIPLWQEGTVEEERSGDEAAVAWLSTVTGSNGTFNPYSTAILAIGRK